MEADTRFEIQQRTQAAIDEKSIATWETLRREDPEMFQLELGIAQTGRILASDRPGSPQYAEALREDHRCRDRRYELWSARALANPPKKWK